MTAADEQIDFFRHESSAYFARNFEGKSLRDIPLSGYIEPLLQLEPVEIEGGALLEIGCGAANNLYHLSHRLKTVRGVGTEPSAEVAERLARHYPEFEFFQSDSRRLPFRTDEFDLVLLRSVLHWVDRNYLLQTLGEAIRVTRRFLLVSDFSPHQPYSVVYRHEPDYRTFKTDYRHLVEATGFMRCRASVLFNDHDPWNVIRTSLFAKIPFAEAFPVREREDFAIR
jgi:ubiquinone/menaquinone biosynthesis C-methylase UbiE